MTYVTHLFKKVVKGQPMVSFHSEGIYLKEKFGVEGDVNANPFTPRQILITCEENLKKHNIKPGDLKENIVIEGLDVDSLESGSVVKIGSVKIRITFNCEPCSYVETIRKGLAKEIHGNRGILGVVLASGNMRVGDKFEVLDEKYPPIPFNVAERFKWFIDQIPSGKVVSYTQIIKSLGLFSVYYRVLPTYIRKCALLGSPVHRIVDSSGEILEVVEEQKRKLNSECVNVIGDKVNLEEYSWDPSDIYYR